MRATRCAVRGARPSIRAKEANTWRKDAFVRDKAPFRPFAVGKHTNAIRAMTPTGRTTNLYPPSSPLRGPRRLGGKSTLSKHKKCPTTASGRRARSWGTARSCNPVGCTGSAVQPLATVTIIGHRSPPFRRVTPTNAGVTHLPPGCLHSPASQGAHRPKTLRWMVRLPGRSGGLRSIPAARRRPTGFSRR